MFKQPSMARALLVSGGVGVIWLVLAWRNPSLTYHFAPLIGGAIWPLSLRSQGQASAQDGRIAAAGALAMMLVVTVILLIGNAMAGPNFLHQGPAWPEAVLFAVVGAAIGMRTATRERPGLLGGLVDASG